MIINSKTTDNTEESIKKFKESMQKYMSMSYDSKIMKGIQEEVIKSQNARLCLELCKMDYINADADRLGEVIVESNDAQVCCEYAKIFENSLPLGKTELLGKINNVIFQSGDVPLIINYLINVSCSDKEVGTKMILSIGTIADIVTLAINHKYRGSDEDLVNLVINSGDYKQMAILAKDYNYCIYADKLEQAILEAKNPEASYEYIKEVRNAKVKEHYEIVKGTQFDDKECRSIYDRFIEKEREESQLVSDIYSQIRKLTKKNNS